MKHSFVQIWNSYRHIADLDPIAVSDDDLFYFFANYNFLCCQQKVYNKIDDDEVRSVFQGHCMYSYADSHKSLDIELPEDFSLKAYNDKNIQLMNQISSYSGANRKESIFEELIMFFMYEMKSLSHSEECEQFCSEVYLHFESLHNEGWAVIKNSSSYPVVTDSLLDAFQGMKLRLPE